MTEKTPNHPSPDQTPPSCDKTGTPESKLEAILFVSDEPVSLKRLGELVGEEVTQEQLTAVLREMAQKLEQDPLRGLKMIELAGGWQLATKPETADIINNLLTKRRSRTLGEASLETLAIVAYKQPVTRAEVENIRGVAVEGALHTLLQRRLIRFAGRKEVPGRPYLYRTTKEFLKYFGLPSLNELPDPQDFKPPEQESN